MIGSDFCLSLLRFCCVSLSLYVFIFVLQFIAYVLVVSYHASDVIILYIINKWIVVDV